MRNIGLEHLNVIRPAIVTFLGYCHTSQTPSPTGSQIYVPPAFQSDFARVPQLQALTQRDPSAISLLIQLFERILERLQPGEHPTFRAAILNYLCLYYPDLPTGDHILHVEQAISYGQEALLIRTPEAGAFDYAMTQNNLGNAYLSRRKDEREKNLLRAIECYREALRFWTPENAPFDYPMVQTNLGAAYTELPSDRGTNLARAIQCYEEALRYYRLEAFPPEYARTQSNLGLAYAELPTGDRGENLEKAIICYRKALRINTLEAAPRQYAALQTNLGTAYRDLPTGNREENQRKAIKCYQEALCVQTPEVDPFACRVTSHNLADLHLAKGDWLAALDAYRSAINAGERIYQAGLSYMSKATEMAVNTEIYRHAAFTAAYLGKTTEALLILERGKTRLLVEALRLRIPQPANVPDAVWANFEQAGVRLRAVYTGDRVLPGQELGSAQFYTTREREVRAANTALDVAIKQVRQYAPDFLEELDHSTLGALLPDEYTALVAFCVTDQGSMGIVVDSSRNENVRIVDVPGFTQTDLNRLLFGELDGREPRIDGWVGTYQRGDTDRWRDTMEPTLVEVGEKLMKPILSTLPLNVEQVIFLPSGGLFLLPLHAVPLSPKFSAQFGDNHERVCDRYVVSYAPSAKVLRDCQARAARKVENILYAVINPEEDPQLVFTSTEGASIAGFFVDHAIREGRAGTKDEVTTGVRGQAYVHFSCHGYYDWDNPPESGLALANARLTLAELQEGTVDLAAARLVTLSACETGLTDVIKGSAEEYVGLPAGFLLAGVPCVVSSLWVVQDLSTSLVMERFYNNHLKGKMAIATALREAQLWVRELPIEAVADYAEQAYQQAPRQYKAKLLKYARHYRYLAKQELAMRPFAHPFCWAAFTVNGM